jgi:hypothetical protein
MTTKPNAAPSTLTLTRRRVWPDGGCSYVVEGLDGATLYVKRGLLAGDPPEQFTITATGLVDPVAVAAERKAKAEARKAAEAEKRAAEAAAEAASAQPVPQPQAPVAKPQPEAATRKAGKRSRAA